LNTIQNGFIDHAVVELLHRHRQVSATGDDNLSEIHKAGQLIKAPDSPVPRKQKLLAWVILLLAAFLLPGS